MMLFYRKAGKLALQSRQAALRSILHGIFFLKLFGKLDTTQ
jgi:hypothetical protein